MKLQEACACWRVKLQTKMVRPEEWCGREKNQSKQINFSENMEEIKFSQAREQVRTVLQPCLQQGIKPCRFNTGQQTSSRVECRRYSLHHEITFLFYLIFAKLQVYFDFCYSAARKRWIFGKQQEQSEVCKTCPPFAWRWLMEHGNSSEVHQNLTKCRKKQSFLHNYYG